MLTTLTLVLALATASPTHTLTTRVHDWSTTTFEVSVNGKEVLKPGRREKIDLSPYLKPGSNTVEVRYWTDDGKISVLQPATLVIDARDGTENKRLLSIAASMDNPRGRRKIELVVR